MQDEDGLASRTQKHVNDAVQIDGGRILIMVDENGHLEKTLIEFRVSRERKKLGPHIGGCIEVDGGGRTKFRSWRQTLPRLHPTKPQVGQGTRCDQVMRLGREGCETKAVRKGRDANLCL